jgi:glutamine---fructose-6-phosphate transaminase (isomerizing)
MMQRSIIRSFRAGAIGRHQHGGSLAGSHPKGLGASSHHGSNYWATGSKARFLGSLASVSNYQDSGKSQSKGTFGFLLAAAAAGGLISWQSDETTMCSGILGVVGGKGSSREFFSQGLQQYHHRGFDAVGIVSYDPSKNMLIVNKHAIDDVSHGTATSYDSLNELMREHFDALHVTSSTGMAHTRWATSGSKTDPANAHPHLDTAGKIAIVHNGTLTNARELRRKLEQEGIEFRSQTDSEVIAHLISKYYNGPEKMSLRAATEKALSRCDGTWGLSVISVDSPDELVVACNGSNLFIGIGSDRMYVASEVSAFSKYTKNFIQLRDGEIGTLHADGHALDLGRQELAPSSEEEQPTIPDSYAHWTLKEIMEQPEAIARALGFGGRISWDKVYLGGLDGNKKKLSMLESVILAGCGSSLNAAKYGEKLFKYLQAVEGRISWLDCVEINEDDYPTTSTGLIAISQSGETKEVKEVVEHAVERNVIPISVVNAVGSTVARSAQLGVYCNAGPEIAIASTKTFTAQVTILALIALWFRQLRTENNDLNSHRTVEIDRLKEALLRLPISLGMALKCRDKCRKVAERLKDKQHCFVLGKGKHFVRWVFHEKGRENRISARVSSDTHFIYFLKLRICGAYSVRRRDQTQRNGLSSCRGLQWWSPEAWSICYD